MKYLVFAVGLIIVSLSLNAKSDDLEQTMKNMGLAYKQSVQATQLDEFNKAIDELIRLVQQSQQHTFHNHKQESLQGLEYVLKQAELAKKLANEQGLPQAKEPLQEIDKLRKKYHELHEPPGFWELLFGK